MNSNSGNQCDYNSVTSIIIGVTSGFIGIAVGIISGLIVAVIIFKKMR